MQLVEDDHKTPFEHTLDLCVFAPLGFALEARSLLPKFIDRGRNQIVLARVVGKYAVRKGTVAAEGALGQAQEQALGVLRLAGLTSDGDDAATPSTDTKSNGHRAAQARPKPPVDTAGTDVVDAPGSDADATGEDAARPVDRAAPAPSSSPTQRREPPFAPELLAIPDYDSLSASQVVPRLESLTTDELESVREYEAATRARKTILNKIVQLQST